MQRVDNCMKYLVQLGQPQLEALSLYANGHPPRHYCCFREVLRWVVSVNTNADIITNRRVLGYASSYRQHPGLDKAEQGEGREWAEPQSRGRPNLGAGQRLSNDLGGWDA